MAELAVAYILTDLVRLLIGEPELPKDVYKDIRDIKNDLERIQSFLKDADTKADLSYGVKIWVKQVREVAYNIEDVIDEYMLSVGVGRQRYSRILGRCFDKVAHPIRKLKIGYELANEIERIKTLVREITESNLSFDLKIYDQGLGDDGSDPSFHRVSHSLFVKEETEPFVLESSRDLLTSSLEKGGSKRSLIPVAGMGGMGKTTLVKNVYNSQIKNGRFDCYAWITISQSYKLEELHKSMINQFYKAGNESMLAEEIESMEEKELVSKVWHYLREKRYFVVFDDVWNIDFWTSMQHALPDTNNGSRVIITTRIRDVALSCQESSIDHVHWLSNPPKDKAWELFCKKAFLFDFGGICPLELEELSHCIVNRCQGLPLAIAVIGGLLSTKDKSVSQWQNLYDRLIVDSESDHNGIFGILLLGYQDLPYNLKSCFLYFGIFPENYSVNCNRLIKLWIAEGFVEGQKGKTLEEVAGEYLVELVHRNLVHVSEVNFDGKARSCRVHDLMRDLIISISQELGFCQVLADENSILVGRARRISIHENIDALKSLLISVTRSIFLFKVDKLPDTFMATLCVDFKLLKLLDFQDSPLENLPKEVGNLFHLRYISIRGTKVKKLPKTIGMLHNLETMDIKFTGVHELPSEINRLLKLRHILAGKFGDGVEIQEGVGVLEALQKLYYVDANHGIGIIKELGKLRQLRKLGIMKLMTKDCQKLCSSIEKMNHLQSLHVDSLSEDEIIDLKSISPPPRFLQHLHLKGRLGQFPNWVAALKNLVRLHLVMSKLVDDPLNVLQALPNLLLLGLHQAYDGENLYFEAGGFPKLKRLELNDLMNLHVLKIDDGALPILEELTIGPSPQLEKVPFGIEHLHLLTTLTYVDMPKSFVRTMLPNEGKDYWKVEHISAVLFKEKEKTYRTYNLRDPNKLKEFVKACYPNSRAGYICCCLNFRQHGGSDPRCCFQHILVKAEA